MKNTVYKKKQKGKNTYYTYIRKTKLNKENAEKAKKKKRDIYVNKY